MKFRAHIAAQGYVADAHGVTRTAIGDKLWLFHKSTGRAKQLLIWAHGGQTLINTRFTPNVHIAWLCPHDRLLASPWLNDHFDTDKVKYHELTGKADQVYNYNLSKMPGHAPKMQEDYADIHHAVATRRLAMDVLTIRNRFGKSMDLKDVLAALGNQYPIIMLSCCRGGRFTSEHHSALGNPAGNSFSDITGYTALNL